jgi:DNA invertase Pin-like site-specific DNA recombinase
MGSREKEIVRAIGYVRVSTGGQVESGAGLDAQREALMTDAARRGWTLTIVADEGLSGGTMKRPALIEALARLDRGEADVLMASKLDRVSRSVTDFAELLERATEKKWRLVLLDLGVDTSTPAGEFVANTIANSAQYERRLTGQRTREALAAKKATGVRLGRPSGLSTETIARIVQEHRDGASLRKIGAGLEADGVLTGRGGTKWHASAVKAVLESQDAAVLVR